MTAEWHAVGSRKRQVGSHLADVDVATMKRRIGDAWVDVAAHERNTHVTPIPTSSMRIGLTTRSATTESLAQLRTDWDNAVTLFGPMRLSRGLYYGANDSLPASPQYFTPQGVVQIPSFRNPNFTSITSFMQNMRGPEKKITFHHEPESTKADDYGVNGGNAFKTQFRAAYNAVKAINPDVQVGMAAGGFQYSPGQNGTDGNYIPLPDKCDFYSIDTYRTGESTGTTGAGALVGLADVGEFQTWYGYVKDLGKPLLVTEYGRGFSYAPGTRYGNNNSKTWTQAQHDNALARRPGLIANDYQWLKSHGFVGWNLWWDNFSPGDDWMFSDQPSIDAWAAVVAAEAST